MQVTGFFVSPGSAEALIRWGRKTSGFDLIAYFLVKHVCQKISKSVDVRWSHSQAN